MWIRHQLENYGIKLNNVSIRCDNTSIINLSKNSILYFRTKHREIRHHFIRDQIMNGIISLDYINTKNQLADIFTKPLKVERFYDLRRGLGMHDPFE